MSKNIKFLKNLFEKVEECKGWKLEFDFEQCFCDNERKVIAMWKDYVIDQPWYYVKEAFLHEVAHIGEKRAGSWVTHDEEFFKRFGNLLIKYSHLSIDDLT